MVRKRGFTLIELLVVVAIIGILATVVVVNLSSAQIKARDAVRKSDLQTISQAMQLYYNQYGVIPNVDLNRDSTPRYSAPGGFPDTGCDSSWFFITGSTTAGCSYDPGVNPPSTVSYSANTSFKDKMAEFLPALPKDPKTGQNINHGGGLYSRYGYILLENGVNYAYQLKVLLEGATGDLGSANRCSGILWSGTGTTPTNMQWDNATYGSHARVELCRL